MFRKTFEYILIFLAVALTIFVAVANGKLLHRWGINSELQTLLDGVNQFPEQFGSWKRISQSELASSTQNMLHVDTSLLREYSQLDSETTVECAILVGPAGPIAVHTPEVCYANLDYRAAGPRILTKIGSDQFWIAGFQSKNLDGKHLLTAYGWWSDEKWRAPESARIEFAGQPHLCKLQLAIPIEGSVTEQDRQVAEKFLSEFTQTFRRQSIK